MCVVGIEDCGYREHCWYWECVLTLGNVGFESIEVLLLLGGVRIDVLLRLRVFAHMALIVRVRVHMVLILGERICVGIRSVRACGIRNVCDGTV